MTTFKIGDDILDTRDVEERIDELEALENDYEEARDDYDAALEGEYGATQEELDDLHRDMVDAADNFSASERAELNTLRDFRCELEGYCEWNDGDTLIEDGYFETYAEQLAKDLDLVKSDATWPNMYIDWAAAAEALKVDYTEADIDGWTYHVRCM